MEPDKKFLILLFVIFVGSLIVLKIVDDIVEFKKLERKRIRRERMENYNVHRNYGQYRPRG